MPRRILVHLLPEAVTPDLLTGQTVAVIDVLRATTVIVYALEAGARQVIACREVEETRRVAATFDPGTVVLGGERESMLIDGFDLGNSPSEYTRKAVSGRAVVFTTTNGTKAISACRRAERVVIASFANCTAVTQDLASSPEVHLLCAGLQGGISLEDTLCAGAIVEKLYGDDQTVELNDEARLALAAWKDVVPGTLAEVIAAGQGGRNLSELGFADDIDVAAGIDRFPIVPRYNPTDGSIQLD